jgi:hypothetical protein
MPRVGAWHIGVFAGHDLAEIEFGQRFLIGCLALATQVLFVFLKLIPDLLRSLAAYRLWRVAFVVCK